MKLKILLSLVLLFSASTMIFAEEHKPPDSKHVELDYLRNRPKDTTPEEVNATCYSILPSAPQISAGTQDLRGSVFFRSRAAKSSH